MCKLSLNGKAKDFWNRGDVYEALSSVAKCNPGSPGLRFLHAFHNQSHHPGDPNKCLNRSTQEKALIQSIRGLARRAGSLHPPPQHRLLPVHASEAAIRLLRRPDTTRVSLTPAAFRRPGKAELLHAERRYRAAVEEWVGPVHLLHTCGPPPAPPAHASPPNPFTLPILTIHESPAAAVAAVAAAADGAICAPGRRAARPRVVVPPHRPGLPVTRLPTTRPPFPVPVPNPPTDIQSSPSLPRPPAPVSRPPHPPAPPANAPARPPL